MPLDSRIILGGIAPDIKSFGQARMDAIKQQQAEQQLQIGQLNIEKARRDAAAKAPESDDALLQEVVKEANGDPTKIPEALLKRGKFKQALDFIEGWDKHLAAQKEKIAPPPEMLTVQTMEGGVPGTKIVPKEAGAFYPSVPKAENPANAPNVGSFEDYVIRAYGQNPTPAQITKARKDYMQADDKATGFAAGDVTQLSPAGLDMAALMYKKTGVMPALGMGDRTTRQKLINRAAELTTDDMARIEQGAGDIAANKAGYRASSDTLTKLTQQRAAISSFEQTAQKNIDLFLDTAGKVVDTGSPVANSLLRNLSGAVLGSPNQAAYEAARRVAVNEIAKVTSNPTLSGQLSDAARKEVESFNPASATLKQTVAVMRLLKKDMANRISSLDQEIATAKGTLKTPTPTKRFEIISVK